MFRSTISTITVSPACTCVNGYGTCRVITASQKSAARKRMQRIAERIAAQDQSSVLRVLACGLYQNILGCTRRRNIRKVNFILLLRLQFRSFRIKHLVQIAAMGIFRCIGCLPKRAYTANRAFASKNRAQAPRRGWSSANPSGGKAPHPARRKT